MINRVTEKMKYDMMSSSLFNVQTKSNELMEKLSTQKMINRPSDNPIGASNVLNYNSALASIDQYQTNIANAKTWLSLTDTNLSGIKDIIGQASDIAISQSSAVASAETMDSNAAVLTSLINDSLSLLNAKQGDSYLFGGSKTDVAPFSATPDAASIDAATAATANAFDGTVTSSGAYTGTENKTYAVKIITSGTSAAATYEISADGGKTWGAQQNFPPQEVKGAAANMAGASPVTATTIWNAIDGANVQDNTSFTITGKQHDGTVVAGTYTLADASTGTVQDLLDQINTTFGGTAIASVDVNGKITVTDTTAGASQMEMTLVTSNQPGGSLDFGAVNATATKTITLGDGINMTFSDTGSHHLKANDLFTVNAYPAGCYRGNNDNLTVQIGKGNNFAYNITGSSAFTVNNRPVASASVVGAGAGLTENDNIILTHGAAAGSWTLTNHTQYPNMVITSTSATTVTIDADGDGTDDVSLALSGKWNDTDTASFSITTGTPPTLSSIAAHGPGTVDLLTTLNALKAALEAHDVAAVSAQEDDLNNAQTQVLERQTAAGSKMNSLELAGNNHTALKEQITSMKSGVEDIDQAKIIMSYQMEQVAMEASYNLAAQIGKMTILNFL